MGKSKPDSMYTSRNPVSATACIAATWLGIAAPIMFPNAVTVNMYRIVATMKRRRIAGEAQPETHE